MPQDNEKTRKDVTEEPREVEQSQQNEQDVDFEAEELEERIAPGKGFTL